jgi:hypothetical protein
MAMALGTQPGIRSRPEAALEVGISATVP